MPDEETKENRGGGESIGLFFAFFTEIGILNQLSTNRLQQRLPDGVTVIQFSVLNHLIRVRDGQTPLHIANAFQVPKTSMTHSLSGLEKRGLVEMKTNPDDGRSKCVWLTDAGKQFINDAIAAMQIDMQRIVPQLNIDKIQAALPILQEVRELLDNDR